MKDQLILLLLLQKLKELGLQTRRINMQKLAYLTDIFGTIIERKPTAYTFKVWKYGPFSKEVQSDIERLVTIGYAKAQELEKWDINQDRSFKYELERPGIEKVQNILEMPEFSTAEKATEVAVQAAGHLSGESIRKLVYSEPNFIKAKERGFGTIIDPEYKFAVRFREMSYRISLEKLGYRLNEEEISWLYLNFIRTIQSQHGR
jgi:uncharacterized phage-associated protein